MITHATIFSVQNKTQFYIEQMLGVDFIPLAIETYNCFHLHFDSFLTFCVNVNITCHQQNSLLVSMFTLIIGNKC